MPDCTKAFKMMKIFYSWNHSKSRSSVLVSKCAAMINCKIVAILLCSVWRVFCVMHLFFGYIFSRTWVPFAGPLNLYFGNLVTSSFDFRYLGRPPWNLGIWSICGRYASYWNAFLLMKSGNLIEVLLKNLVNCQWKYSRIIKICYVQNMIFQISHN